MQGATIKILFKRHGIPLDNTVAANDTIESIVFDNPSILYPQTIKNGIYDIDWENEILYVREHRKDVQFDDHDRVEMCLEFDNIQRILFKLTKGDYEDDTTPGEHQKLFINTINNFTYTKEEYVRRLNVMVVEYMTGLLAETRRLSKVNGNNLLIDNKIPDRIIESVSHKIAEASSEAYTGLEVQITGFKQKLIQNIDELKVRFDVNSICDFMNNSVHNCINGDLLDGMFIKHTGVTVYKYMNDALFKSLDTMMHDTKHEYYVDSEVTLKKVDGISIDSEVKFEIPVILEPDQLEAEEPIKSNNSKETSNELNRQVERTNKKVTIINNENSNI